MVSVYLLDLLFLLIAAVIIVPLFQLARLGTVPGFLVAGVIVGPSGLAIIDNVTEIRHLSQIGAVLLLFVIGMELKPSRLWLMRRLVFGLGTLQVIVTGVVLGVLGHYLFDFSLRTAIFVGPALALSSTAFVLQILAEQKQLTTRYGRAVISVLLLHDLAVVPLLALIPLLASPDSGFSGDIGLALLESLFILLLVVVTGRFLLHPLLHRVARAGSPEVFTASAVLIVLGTAMATEHAGLSMAMGAFLAGLLISESAYLQQVIAEIQPFRGLLLGLFFMSMGMSFELHPLLANPLAALSMLILLLFVKTVILFPLARLFGLDSRVSLAVALLLAQCGEFALVLFALAVQSGLLTGPRFQSLLVIVLLSMMVTPLLARLASQLATVEERQNRRLAEILHDTLAQDLFAASAKLSLLNYPDRLSDPSAVLQEVADILAHATELTRTLTFELFPPALYVVGLDAALDEISKNRGTKYDEDAVDAGAFFLDADGFFAAYEAMVTAHARMYDAVKEHDREDADGDGDSDGRLDSVRCGGVCRETRAPQGMFLDVGV